MYVSKLQYYYTSPTRGQMAQKKKHKKNDKIIFYSGNRNGKFENGVGFVMNDSILPHVKTFQAINERICYIRITVHIFNVLIINCYAQFNGI